MTNQKLKVINLFSGPGAGKSTTAAGLFYLMKIRGASVELVTEYAKEIVWDENWSGLKKQERIFTEQNNRLKRLIGKVEYAVTDSPILLSHIYASGEYLTSRNFLPLIDEEFSRYNNINFFLKRKKEYVAVGRTQTKEEAENIDRLILNLLDSKGIGYNTVVGDETAPYSVLKFLNI